MITSALESFTKKDRSQSRDFATTNLPVLASLYVFELAAFFFLFAISRTHGRPILTFLFSRPGVTGIGALASLGGSGTFLVHQYLSRRQPGLRQEFVMTVMMNFLSVISFLITAEFGVRFFSSETANGRVLMKILLLPREWDMEVARNQRLYKKASIGGSYQVYDDLMGWTVGRNRRSADGLAFSSVEGIRSPRSGMSFADSSPAYRIAAVGDSFTFGLDVKYEETWGYQLERELGAEFQVLNFGVSGYGIDQAYLRYRRDVRPWKPQFVIFGVFPNDFVRSLTVYNFVSFPDWDNPFSKPRFVMDDGKLVPVNVPALDPQAIFSKKSIRDLPYLELDHGYHQTDWEWRFYHHIYLFRLLLSLFPVGYSPNEQSVANSEEAMKSVNLGILRSFIQLASTEGSIPIIIYFPATVSAKTMGPTQTVLHNSGIPYIDMKPCLNGIPVSDIFIGPMGHYTPRANAAVGHCLQTVIAERLSATKPRSNGTHAAR